MEVTYVNANCVRDHDFRTEMDIQQPLQRAGSDSVKIKNYRAAVVCLVLLCVLLLNAVIALGVITHTIRMNYLPVVGKDQGSDNPKWIKYKSSSYYISSKWKNWNESRQDCLQRGADLIIINNRDEHDFIAKVTNGNLVWIGLNEIFKEGVWKWVDGSVLTTWFWRDNEPNNAAGDEDCVASAFEWADYPCDYAFVWICERNLTSMV